MSGLDELFSRRSRRLISALTGAAVLGAPGFAVAQGWGTSRPSSSRARSVVLLAVPGLRPSDLARPELGIADRIAAAGAIGWMNCRSGASGSKDADPVASGFLSLGAGTRAMSPGAATLPDIGTHGPATIPDFRGLQLANDALPHRVHLGSLGDVCRMAGLSLHVVGDEGGGSPALGGALLASDSAGTVDRLDAALIRDETAPYGRRADLSAYATPDEQSLTVWVFGDLLRAESYAPLCTPEMARYHRETALRRLAALLRERWFPVAQQAAMRGGQAWLLSPATSMAADPLDRLTPVALIGPEVRPGWITSATTRRPGVISIADIVPTIARHLDVQPPSEVVGRPAHSSRAGAPKATDWLALHSRLLATSTIQRRLGPLPIVRLAVLLIIGLQTLLAYRSARFGHALQSRIAGPPGVAIAAAAMLQAWSGALPRMDVAAGAVLLAGTVVVAAGVASVTPRLVRALIMAACAATIGACLLGMLGFSAIVTDGWLSYSVMEAARWYGIGNEMAGALLAASVALAAQSLRAGRSWTCVAAFIGLGLALAWPSGGANLGAAVAAATGAAFAASAGLPRSRRMPILLTVSAVLVLSIVGLAVLMDTGAAASHIGPALGNVRSVGDIASRKIALNARLLLMSPWSPCLLVGAAMTGLALRKGAQGALRAGLTMLMVVAAALLIANDSGVVAAGMAFSVGLPALMGAFPYEPTQAKRVADDADR